MEAGATAAQPRPSSQPQSSSSPQEWPYDDAGGTSFTLKNDNGVWKIRRGGDNDFLSFHVHRTTGGKTTDCLQEIAVGDSAVAVGRMMALAAKTVKLFEAVNSATKKEAVKVIVNFEGTEEENSFTAKKITADFAAQDSLTFDTKDAPLYQRVGQIFQRTVDAYRQANLRTRQAVQPRDATVENLLDDSSLRPVALAPGAQPPVRSFSGYLRWHQRAAKIELAVRYFDQTRNQEIAQGDRGLLVTRLQLEGREVAASHVSAFLTDAGQPQDAFIHWGIQIALRNALEEAAASDAGSAGATSVGLNTLWESGETVEDFFRDLPGLLTQDGQAPLFSAQHADKYVECFIKHLRQLETFCRERSLAEWLQSSPGAAAASRQAPVVDPTGAGA